MSFLLVENGKSKAKIVIQANADRVVRFAAGELRKYLGIISGSDFTIFETDSVSPTGTIALIVDPKRFEKPELDGFSIFSNSEGLSIRGSNSRSVLYGVYELLETLGCGFVEPGKETIPSADILTVPDLDQSSVAAFPLRNIFRIQILKSKTHNFEGIEPGHHIPQIDWMAKRKLNHYVFYVDYHRYDLWEKKKHQILDALLDRGFDIEVTHHSIQYFCPPDNDHDFGDYGPETYRENHPDWFLEGQVRVELPEARDIITERLLQYLRDNPEVKIIGLWPGDSGINKLYPDLTFTDGYMKFWNQVAADVAVEFPEKELCCLAYLNITEPPQTETPAANIHNWFCRHDDNYMYPPDAEENQKVHEMLLGWTRKMDPGKIACFNYYGWKAIFTPFAERMKKSLTIYRELGLRGLYGWCGFTHNLMGADFRWAREMYVFAELLWNPDKELDKLTSSWT
ncbi:MAG: DUF4838 domain-containing protein, partial [Victivallales bacterium]|nr:DUF4838 domain-containing protein [Victivallales bacterium]